MSSDWRRSEPWEVLPRGTKQRGISPSATHLLQKHLCMMTRRSLVHDGLPSMATGEQLISSLTFGVAPCGDVSCQTNEPQKGFRVSLRGFLALLECYLDGPVVVPVLGVVVGVARRGDAHRLACTEDGLAPRAGCVAPASDCATKATQGFLITGLL